ncbi:S8 family serine peptidase [Actinospongicola halichondriae]|uniref:S8 family serine peptidase n=1 Tax=Actinospongicola halichondriae TaxID=3236844 RepID=UPI003D545345
MTDQIEHGGKDVQPVLGTSLHRRGLTGHGVGIAIIDSGVTAPGEFGDRLVAGPDFTVDAGTVDEALDRTGHGTHLAGIAAGTNVGVAPGSHVISVKVAGEAGATDVDAVIAGIDWTVAHRHQLSIGVLLLAFGADQLPVGEHDPLAAAVSRAWRSGVVVVTSAGNSGDEAPLSTPTHIADVLTVAAAEQVEDGWAVCDFSSRGDDAARPDVSAPGKSLVGPIAPGSESENAPESSIVAPGYVKGSGSSQAAAAAAGAAALLLHADPTLTPDEVKHILCTSAVRIDDVAAGAGVIDLDVALACLASGIFRPSTDTDVAPTADAWAGLEWSGNSWRGLEWSGNSWRGLEWSGNSWRGLEWSGNSWRGLEWSGNSWRGLEWSGNSWRGLEWSGNSWRGLEWSGNSWRGLEWSGNSWRGLEWSGNSWRGLEWSGNSWRGLEWSGNSWRGLEWSGNSWRGLEWSGNSWRGLEWSGNSWRGLEWSGNSWRGLEWSGNSWRGLEWSGNSWRGLEWSGNSWR